MGYYNPIYVYGVEGSSRDAKAAGVDGLIVVDLPPEEDDELCLPALEAGLAFIRLATPTTDDARLPAVLANTSRLRLLRLDHRHHRRRRVAIRRPSARRSSASSAIRPCRSLSGSACKNAQSAAAIAAHADGVVVGSALIDVLKASLDAEGRAGRDTV